MWMCLHIHTQKHPRSNSPGNEYLVLCCISKFEAFSQLRLCWEQIVILNWFSHLAKICFYNSMSKLNPNPIKDNLIIQQGHANVQHSSNQPPHT